MTAVKQLWAREILDSRGKPTVKATCELRGGAVASASVPSGASTGAGEALELRDGEARYGGQGCRKAAANVSGPIHEAVKDRDIIDQSDFDQKLIALDGTSKKSRLGANAILAASLAFARAAAVEAGVPLYAHFAAILGNTRRTLPRLTINLFSGGKHAGGQAPIQDVLLVPVSAKTIDEGLAMTHAAYRAAAEITLQKYDMRPLRADEGGLAPPFPCVEAMFEDAVEAIERAGYQPGYDVALAVDVASSHFYRDGTYHLTPDALDAAGMIARIDQWVKNFPIVSVEDGLSEEDWPHWPSLKQTLVGRALTLGDDFLCTNPARIKRAVVSNAADALLLKVNQIGTLTEAAAAARLARSAGWRITVSARSGETEDDWLADLAVGWGGDQIKVGSITQSERLTKYNRLLEIEAETRWPMVEWPAKG